MLKKTIKYTDFDGKPAEEVAYFHMNKAELIEMQMSHEDGFAEYLQRIIDANDGGQIVKTLKEIILMAYGERSEDGKRFKKSKEISEDFASTEAFAQFFLELATDPDDSAAFVNGILPANWEKDVAAVAKKQKKAAEKTT